MAVSADRTLGEERKETAFFNMSSRKGSLLAADGTGTVGLLAVEGEGGVDFVSVDDGCVVVAGDVGGVGGCAGNVPVDCWLESSLVIVKEERERLSCTNPSLAGQSSECDYST